MGRDVDLQPWLAATGLSLIGLFNIVGTYVFGSMGGKYLQKNVLAVIYLGRSLVFLVFMLTPISVTSVLLFSCAIGLLWLGTVPLTSGLVAHFFGPAYMSMLYGFVFFSHQVGSFTGAWLAGYLYDLFGSYDVMWWLNVTLVLVAVFTWPCTLHVQIFIDRLSVQDWLIQGTMILLACMFLAYIALRAFRDETQA